MSLRNNEAGAEFENRPRIQTIAAVLWPSFLSCALTTSALFAIVDPAERFVEFDRIAVYSGFFLMTWFTAIVAACGAVYVLRPVVPKIVIPDDTSSGGEW